MPDNSAQGWSTQIIPSPVGRLQLCASETGLTAVLWERERDGRVPLPQLQSSQNAILNLAAEQLAEYFAGTRKTFTVPLAPEGTDFQKQVWQALRAIPFGQTRSYRDIAVTLGNLGAIRAVGAANGRNPISIIVPCHRVIGSDGSLTGFAGGLDAKAWLLRHEGLGSEQSTFAF